jgi:hypothetical protein
MYANLMQVVGQLNAYSAANQGCKAEIQQSLVNLVGPPSPTATVCSDSASLTCLMLATKDGLVGVADDLKAAGVAAVAALQPQTMQDVEDKFTALSGEVADIATQASKLIAQHGLHNFTVDLGPLEQAVDAADQAVDDFILVLADVNQRVAALNGILGSIGNDAQQAVSELGSAAPGDGGMLEQTDAVAAQVCSLIASGGISQNDGNLILAYLANQQSCPSPGVGSVPPSASFSGPLRDRLAAQSSDLSGILSQATASTVPKPLDTAEMAIQVNAVKAALAAVRTKLADLDAQNAGFHSLLGQELQSVNGTAVTLGQDSTALGTSLTALGTHYSAVATTVGDAFTDAADSAAIQAHKAAAGAIIHMNTQLRGGLTALDTKFGQSSKGLESAAGAITTNGAEVVDTQRLTLATEQKKIGGAVAERMQSDAVHIDQSIAASTKNLEAASALLTADLQKVLLDLGDKTKRTGLLGTISTSAATAESANSKLALAGQSVTSYANVRGQDVSGIQLRQAQTQAALRALADLPPFRLTLPSGADYRTIYTIHLGGSEK